MPYTQSLDVKKPAGKDETSDIVLVARGGKRLRLPQIVMAQQPSVVSDPKPSTKNPNGLQAMPQDVHAKIPDGTFIGPIQISTKDPKGRQAGILYVPITVAALKLLHLGQWYDPETDTAIAPPIPITSPFAILMGDDIYYPGDDGNLHRATPTSDEVVEALPPGSVTMASASDTDLYYLMEGTIGSDWVQWVYRYPIATGPFIQVCQPFLWLSQYQPEGDYPNTQNAWIDGMAFTGLTGLICVGNRDEQVGEFAVSRGSTSTRIFLVVNELDPWETLAIIPGWDGTQWSFDNGGTFYSIEGVVVLPAGWMCPVVSDGSNVFVGFVRTYWNVVTPPQKHTATFLSRTPSPGGYGGGVEELWVADNRWANYADHAEWNTSHAPYVVWASGSDLLAVRPTPESSGSALTLVWYSSNDAGDTWTEIGSAGVATAVLGKGRAGSTPAYFVTLDIAGAVIDWWKWDASHLYQRVVTDIGGGLKTVTWTAVA